MFPEYVAPPAALPELLRCGCAPLVCTVTVNTEVVLSFVHDSVQTRAPFLFTLCASAQFHVAELAAFCSAGSPTL